MGRKKEKNRVSKFEYYNVIVFLIIEMIFVCTMFIVVPCIAANKTYEDLTEAVITIDKIQHISGTRTSRSCYMITSTDGVKYFVYSREGLRAKQNNQTTTSNFPCNFNFTVSNMNRFNQGIDHG